MHSVQFTYVYHLQWNQPCFDLNKQIYISHILDSWRLQEVSSNEERVLPRRYLFFSKFVAFCTVYLCLSFTNHVLNWIKQIYISHILDSWRLQEVSSNEKRVLPRRYLFFSKFVACCIVYLFSYFAIKPTMLLWI